MDAQHGDGPGSGGDDEFRFLDSDAARVARRPPLPAVSRAAIELPDGRVLSGIAYEPGSAPELVALHGAGLNAHSYDPLLLALDRPALALDLPGHGRSAWRADADYRPATLAPDIVTALERLAPHPVALLGHSLGGLTAALAAAQRPELVRSLTIIDITPGVSPRGEAGSVVEFITGRRDYGSVEEIVDRAIRFGIGRDRTSLTRGVTLNTRRRPDGRLEWIHHLAHLDGPTAVGAPADPQPYAPIWEALRLLHTGGTPVSLIRAESGFVDAALAAEWRERLPGSRVVDVPGPHNLHEAAPLALASAIRELGLLR